MRVETTCTNLNLPCPHPYPINVRARRALHIYYLLFKLPLRGNFVPDGAPFAASREIATKKQPYVFRKAVPWCTLFGTLPRANKAPLGLCCRSVRKATDTPCSRPRWRTRPQCPGKLQQKNTPQLLARCLLWCTIGDSNPGPTD